MPDLYAAFYAAWLNGKERGWNFAVKADLNDARLRMEAQSDYDPEKYRALFC